MSGWVGREAGYVSQEASVDAVAEPVSSCYGTERRARAPTTRAASHEPRHDVEESRDHD